jgi:hypothetical protein
VQDCFGVQMGLEEDLPHFLCRFAHQSVFRTGLDPHDFFQRDYKMFLEIVEKRFLSFGLFLMVLWFWLRLLDVFLNLLQKYRRRLMSEPAQFLGSFFPEELTDVIVRFSVMNVLDFFGTTDVDGLLVVEKDFVVGFHLKCVLLKSKSSF